ncbi:MAG: amidohydrolase family protein [Planctomycetota bacterium]|jgi:predicted TIM-barrel fold metal-dependent hydrolase
MSERIIDIHTHAFPDAVAERAMAHLCGQTDEVTAYLDGTLSALLGSMDANNIETSVICSIATKPGQFEPIFEWSKQIASDRIVPLASIHPFDPAGVEHVGKVAEAGLKGIKMHPYYQDFDMDDERLDPLYGALEESGLLLTMHTGFDFAYEWIDQCGPGRIANVLAKFPDLKLITTHFGSWQQWDQVEELLIGKPIYMETSMSMQYLNTEQLRRMLLAHPDEYLLFGTDSPWTDQKQQISAIKQLGLPTELESKMLYENAVRLLDSV